MVHQIDPEISSAMTALSTGTPVQEAPKVADWATRRAATNALLAAMSSRVVVPGPVATDHFDATAGDLTTIPLRLYSPPGADVGGGLVVYLHGGGMFCGTVDVYDNFVRRYAHGSGTKILAVDYRFAPEFPFPYAVEDSYAALSWTFEHADLLGVDPSRVAIAGDSAGGGMAAAVAQMARDRGLPPLAMQVLIYPMLDDRNTTHDPDIAGYLTWNWDDNITGWSALLGDEAGTDAVSPYAAPARQQVMSGLAPTYIDVGTLDIFRDETLQYASRLVAAGVPVELHMHPGAPHAFEALAPESAVAKRALGDRIRVFSEL